MNSRVRHSLTGGDAIETQVWWFYVRPSQNVFEGKVNVLLMNSDRTTITAIGGLCALVVSGCFQPETPPAETRTAQSFVQSYFPVAGIRAQQRDDERIILIWVEPGNPLSEQEAQELCRVHQDVCEEYSYTIPSDDNVFIIAQDFTDVYVSCDRDFDGSHPAGCDLGDVFSFYSVSCYPYIISGQKDTCDWYSEKEDFTDWFLFNKDPRWFPIYKKISELNASDLTLLGPSLRKSCLLAKLKLEKEPDAKGAYSFTVRFADTGGMLFEANPVTLDF